MFSCNVPSQKLKAYRHNWEIMHRNLCTQRCWTSWELFDTTLFLSSAISNFFISLTVWGKEETCVYVRWRTVEYHHALINSRGDLHWSPFMSRDSYTPPVEQPCDAECCVESREGLWEEVFKTSRNGHVSSLPLTAVIYPRHVWKAIIKKKQTTSGTAFKTVTPSTFQCCTFLAPVKKRNPEVQFHYLWFNGARCMTRRGVTSAKEDVWLKRKH